MADSFLIAPQDAEPTAFLAALPQWIERVGNASVLLLPRANHSEPAYKALVKAVAPLAQAHNLAVLIEGDPGQVRSLKADGLHVTGTQREVRAALEALKPDFIVGATTDGTRDDAMTKGEMGVDYLFFGPLVGALDATTRDLATWWAETMDIPSVLSDPSGDGTVTEGCDFVAHVLLEPVP